MENWSQSDSILNHTCNMMEHRSMSDKENRVRTQSVCMKDKHVYIVYILHYISCIMSDVLKMH